MSAHNPSPRERFWMSLEFLLAPLLFRRYLRSLSLNGCERVLEVGSGSGALTREISRAVPNGSVTAVEKSPYWATFAKRRLRKRRNVHVRQGDIQAVDEPSESLHAVFFHFVLHDIPERDRPALLTALLKALAPGGRIYLREPIGLRHGLSLERTRWHFREAGFTRLEERIDTSRVAGRMLVTSFAKEA
jgi:tRNA A58 N-methylase Trm61